MTQKTQHIADYLLKFMPIDIMHHRRCVSYGISFIKLQQILKQILNYYSFFRNKQKKVSKFQLEHCWHLSIYLSILDIV